jgi:hypothetical protein
MFKLKVALLSTLALLAISGIATTAAMAAGPYWHLGGARLEKGSWPASVAKAGETELKAKVLDIPFTITCGASTVEGAEITGNGTSQGLDSAKSIAFEECTIATPKGCAVPQPIKTVAVKSRLVMYDSRKIGDLFEPTKGTEFVTIAFENAKGAECPLDKTEFNVTGSIAAEVKPEEKETKVGELAFPATPIKQIKEEGGTPTTIGLEVGSGNAANFSGKFAVELAVDETFGVFAS